MNKEKKTSERIGAEIASIRISLGMTQKEMAEKANMYVNHIPRLEKGKINIGINTLKKVLDALGYDLKIVKK